LTNLQIAKVCKSLKRATNLPTGATFFHLVEKHLNNEIHQGRLGASSGQEAIGHESTTSFGDLCKISELLFQANVGTNEFQGTLEKFIVEKFDASNLQDVVNLLKGLVGYHLKNEELETVIH